MKEAHRIAERRRHRRVEIAARAEVVVTEGQWMGAYTVENLSAGGALLTGSAGLKRGELVKIWLHLPGESALELVAQVVRVEPRSDGAQAFAAAFREISSDAEDAIQAAVLCALEQQLKIAV